MGGTGGVGAAGGSWRPRSLGPLREVLALLDARPTVAEAIELLDRLCADWPRLDLVKIDAEGAEALVWEGMQGTLHRFPHAAVVLELHLQRDPPQDLLLLLRGCRLRLCRQTAL